MKISHALILFSFIALISNARAQMEEIKIELLEVTVPAGMDDHGKFGLATDDFELKLSFQCGRSGTINWLHSMTTWFDLPANETTGAITHKIKGSSLTIEPHVLKECEERDIVMISLQEDEMFGYDYLAKVSVKDLFYSKNTTLKPNSSVFMTFGEKSRGEAEWTFLGLGDYSPFTVKLKITSKIYK